MTEEIECCLRDAGCAAEFVERYRALEDSGNTGACLDLLRRHRCELICALHEAQRPIDVCDWMIHVLESEA